MAIQKFQSSYFVKDFDTLRSELIARVPIISEGKLTDLNESSVVVTLIELFAAMGDMLAYYIDANALEAFLTSVRQPENVYRHTHLLNYRIREKTAARAYVKFTLSSAFTSAGSEVYIPKGTQLGTSLTSSGMFTTVENSTIPVGQTTSENVLAVQGQASTETFYGDGSANQYATLSSKNIDPSTIEVYTGVVKWSEQDSFLYSKSTDYHYVVETDYLGTTRVYFGDGKFGRVPSNAEEITISFLVTQGELGNVGTGAISLIYSAIRTASNVLVTNITVTNEQAAVGGSERQNLEQVKTNAPGALSALYRPMTKYDYITLIERLAGVLHANVWGEQEEENPSYENMNWANVCIVPVGGGQPPVNLTDTIDVYLKEYQPITVRVRHIPPVYVDINVGITVYIKQGYSSEEIRIQLTDLIRAYFSLDNVQFGQDIRASYFYRMAYTIDGIDYITVDTLEVNEDETRPGPQELILRKWEVPVLDALTVSVVTATELPATDNYPYESL